MSAQPGESFAGAGDSLEGVEVTLVLPCLNEQDGVGDCVERALATFKAAGLKGTVLVVDNGSSDGSVEVAKAAGARVVHQSEPGYGAAVRSGIDLAETEYVVMADADSTYELEAIPRLLQPLVSHDADLVLGARLDHATTSTMPWLHRFVGTPMISRLVNRATGNTVRIRDSQSGFRAFRRIQIQDLALTATGMEFATEMLIRSAWAKFRIVEVQTRYATRIGESKLETFSDGLRHLRQVILLSPDAVATDPGIVMTGLAAFLWILAGFSQQNTASSGSVSWIAITAATILGVIGPLAYCAGLVVRYRAESLGLRHTPPKRPILSFVWHSFFVGVGLMSLSLGLVILLVVNFHTTLFIDFTTQRIIGSIATCAAIVGILLANMPLVSPFLIQSPTRQLPRAVDDAADLPAGD